MRTSPEENLEADFCVIGGGIAGVCAALAAARQGLRTVLIQNRSLLGGNASSEIRQHIGGASFMGHYPDAREGGITDEVWSAVRRKCYGNNLNDFAESSTAILDICWKEPLLQVIFNTHIDVVKKSGNRIAEVQGTQSSTGKRLTVRAGQFADCTGDAHVAYLAGCRYMSGQEGRHDFNESLAPEEPQQLTMGNTLLFQSETLDRPAPYEKPEWAPDLKGRDIYWTIHPPKAPMRHGSWVFEYGGKLDTIGDAEKIHAELIKIVHAAWADLKERFPEEMACDRLSFISSLPGKRESRRVIGDYVLTQGDIVTTQRFPDDVAYAGWSLDLHNPDGFYGKDRPTTFYFFPEIHSVPLRCLYAADVENLWLAGRDISVTHVALGGARLMASCGLQGEAIGIAAVRAQARSWTCRETASTEIKSIQQQILKNGGYIPGVASSDDTDLVPNARQISATSTANLSGGEVEVWEPIGSGMGLALPITSGRWETLQLPVENPESSPVTLTASLQPIRVRRDFHEMPAIKEITLTIPPGTSDAIFQFATDLAPDLWKVLLTASHETLLLGQTKQRITGTHVADHYPDGKTLGPSNELGMPDPPRWIRRFNHTRLNEPEVFHSTPAFRVTPEQHAYAACNVANGVNRPERLPNLWASDAALPLPQSLFVDWSEAMEISEIRIVFDSDIDLPMPPVEGISTLAEDYEVIGWNGQTSTVLASVRKNRNRLAIHKIAPTPVQRLEIRVSKACNEGRQARIFEVRCHKPS